MVNGIRAWVQQHGLGCPVISRVLGARVAFLR